MSEYFYKLLGKRNGILFSIFLIVQFFLLLTVNFIVSGKVLSNIFSISYPLAVCIGGVLILIYLLLAGFKAVIKTDFFQLVIMFVMTLGVAIVLFGDIQNIPLSEFNPSTMGLGNIIGFLILTGMGLLVAPDLWQRIFATKNKTELHRGLSYSSIIIIVLGLLISILGLITKNRFPHIVPEDALVVGFSHLLPGWLVALGMVLLYAVALSSSDTITFVISSIVTRDLKNYSKKYSKESMTRLTRLGMLFFVLCAVILAIYYQNILSLGFSLSSLNLALFPVVFGTFYWKLKERAVFWSLIIAFLSIMVLFILGELNPQTAVISLPIAALFLILFQKLFKK